MDTWTVRGRQIQPPAPCDTNNPMEHTRYAMLILPNVRKW